MHVQGDLSMAILRLNKSGRLRKHIRKKLGSLSLRAEATLSIFAAHPAAEVARRAEAFPANIDRAECLLAILATIRTAAGLADAESGIGALLAEKAGGQTRHVVVGDFLRGCRAQRPVSSDPDRAFRRGEAIAQRVQAMRARYEVAADGDDKFDTVLLDDARLAALRIASW
jgi:hypothetical protein